MPKTTFIESGVLTRGISLEERGEFLVIEFKRGESLAARHA